jgi:protein-disulfide isomerase
MVPVKRFMTAVMVFAATAAFAAEPAQKPAAAPEDSFDRLIRTDLPVCSEKPTIARTDLKGRFSPGINGVLFEVKSSDPSCAGQFVAATSNSGGVFFGSAWFLDQEEGATTEDKLRNFLWRGMQRNFTPVIEKSRTPYGTQKVTLVETTEYGKMPLEGEIDPSGKVFFFGHFRPASSDVVTERMRSLSTYAGAAPARGADKPAVTIMEFSDFECPSCKHAAEYVDPIIAGHGDKVRHVRYDLPLIMIHPWAFTASMAGRAIYRQKPELFWEYKKQVYSNQEKLNAFTIDQFTRGFAEDHGLDLAKYDADLASPALRDELLKSVGTAFSNDVRMTPTYLVNGLNVDPGEDGKKLAEYVEKLLAAK